MLNLIETPLLKVSLIIKLASLNISPKEMIKAIPRTIKEV